MSNTKNDSNTTDETTNQENEMIENEDQSEQELDEEETDDESETMEADSDSDDEESEDGEEEVLSADPVEGEAVEEKAKKPAAPKGPPAHEAFIAAIKAHASALGLGYKDQKGFAQFFNAETGHKLYVAKQGRAVTRVETTLPILGQEGTHKLEKPNGKITCTIDPDLALIEGVLLQLADSAVGKIRAPLRQPKAE